MGKVSNNLAKFPKKESKTSFCPKNFVFRRAEGRPDKACNSQKIALRTK